MATSSIGSTTDTSSTPNTTTPPDRFSELTSSDFVKIMFTELQNQDPMKPNDSNTLLQQFSSLRTIEADISLQDKLQSVVSQGQLSTAGALLGKYVTGYTDNFTQAEGYVNSISQTKDGPILNLSDGSRVAFKNISDIFDPTDPTNPSTNPGTNPGTSPGTNPSTNPTTTPPTYVPPTNTTPATNPTQSGNGTN